MGGFRLLPARVVRAPLACVAGAGLGGAGGGGTSSRAPALRRVGAPARVQKSPLTGPRPWPRVSQDYHVGEGVKQLIKGTVGEFLWNNGCCLVSANPSVFNYLFYLFPPFAFLLLNIQIYRFFPSSAGLPIEPS